MAAGTIKTVVLARGFAFVRPDGGKREDDLFFHARDLRDGLEFDEQLTERRVEFEVVNSPKGAKAANVRPAP